MLWNGSSRRMLQRNIKKFAKILAFIVLFIFFVITTIRVETRSHINVGRSINSEESRFVFDRLLLGLESQIYRHPTIGTKNPVVLTERKTETIEKEEDRDSRGATRNEPYESDKQGEKKQRHPTVIILGVKKAGTRALLDILRMHPDVVGATKEIYFFNGHYHKGLEWYREQMPPSRPGQITIEKSPTYFTSTDKVATVERVYRFSKVISGELKLLVVVRDPTERVLSDYTDTKLRLKRAKGIEIEPLEAYVLNKENQKGIDNSSSIIKLGIYSHYLKKWAQYFTNKQLQFVSGESLVYNTYEEIVLVEKFLNLTRYFTRKHFYFNKRKGFPCFRPNPSKSKKHFCLPANKGRKHVSISSKTVQLLRDFYRPHNENFYQFCNKSFNWP